MQRQAPLWAVYERADGQGFLVYQLLECADGTFEPRVPATAPLIRPLPLCVRAQRTLAVAYATACQAYRYRCAGTA